MIGYVIQAMAEEGLVYLTASSHPRRKWSYHLRDARIYPSFGRVMQVAQVRNLYPYADRGNYRIVKVVVYLAEGEVNLE